MDCDDWAMKEDGKNFNEFNYLSKCVGGKMYLPKRTRLCLNERKKAVFENKTRCEQYT